MKGGEGEAEKKEKLVEKLKREVLVGKSKGPSTPFHSSSKLWLLGPNNSNSNNIAVIQDHRYQPTTVSARKLAAALWEFNHYFPLFQMHNGGAADSRLLRRHYTLHKDKAHDISNFLVDASPSSPDQVPPSFLTFSKVKFLS